MIPPKRRKLTQRLAMVGHTAYSERIDGSMQVTAIEQNDRRSDKIERGSACLLIFQAAITKATKAVESHGSGQRVSRLTLVQFLSDEHTSELQSLMRISSAALCLQQTPSPTHTPPP